MPGSQSLRETVLLLVGDEAIRLDQSLQTLLREEGFCVLSADTGEHALDLSQRFTDKLVLITATDVGGMTAIELYGRIRARRPHTPVLFIVNPGDEGREQFQLPGARVLEEPFSVAEFFETLGAMLLTDKPNTNVNRPPVHRHLGNDRVHRRH